MANISHSSLKIFVSSSNTDNWMTSTSNTKLSVKINPIILADNDPQNMVIGLESASIPLSIYSVNALNNVLKINNYTNTIAPGNYRITALIDYLNNSAKWSPVQSYFTFSYDLTNNQITVVSTDPAFPTTVVVGTTTTSHKILGVTTGTKATGAPRIYVFENVVNLTFTSGVLVSLRNIQTDNRDSQSTGSSGSTIIARIPINCPMYRVLSYFNAQEFTNIIANRVITSLDIELLNDDFTQLSLQGNPNFFLTFRIDFVEKKSYVIPQTEIQQMRQSIMSLGSTGTTGAPKLFSDVVQSNKNISPVSFSNLTQGTNGSPNPSLSGGRAGGIAPAFSNLTEVANPV